MAVFLDSRDNVGKNVRHICIYDLLTLAVVSFHSLLAAVYLLFKTIR